MVDLADACSIRGAAALPLLPGLAEDLNGPDQSEARDHRGQQAGDRLDHEHGGVDGQRDPEDPAGDP